MISIEQWRACIGTFNCKRGYSGFLSSLFSSSSYYYYQPRKRRNASRELSSTADTSLSANSLSPDHEKQSATLLQANTVALKPRSFPTLTVTNVTKISSSSSSSSSGGLLSLRSSHLREVFVVLLMVLLIAIIFQQLIISGDIETNPGPKREDKPDLSDLLHMSYTGEDGKDVHLRLMDQVKPHWRRLAIALKFPQHEIANIASEDDPVYYLFTEWLRGANQEKDPRPVTWGTLITALRDANIQQEANVLEKHFIGDNPAHVAVSQQDQDNGDGSGSPPAKKPRLSPQPNNTGTEKAETQPAIGNQPNDIHPTIPTFASIPQTNWMCIATFQTRESQARERQKKQQLQPIQTNMVNYFQELMEDLQQEKYPPIPQQDPGVEPLEQFKAYLKQVYQQPRSPHRCFEKPGSEYLYQPFNLKLVKTERSPYYELTLHPYENKEVILLRLHNNVDLINNSITAVDMANIGKCEELYSPDCILVQGAPGVGKSAFAWELSRKWAIGEALNNWSLVILVQLENKTVREAKSLQDFIYHPDSTVRKEICKYLKKKKGSGKTLFILDGYDRLSGKQQKNASWLQKLVLKELPKATLMILSRAALTGDMHHQFPFNLNIDQHIDITVFTDENIDKHIASAYSGDPGLATALKSYLSSHPFIHSLMYIPLQCAMVTDLYLIHWKCGDKNFAPKTLTDLYTDLVRTLLLRYLCTHPEYMHSLRDDWVLDKFTDLQSLPGEVHKNFEVLTKLAAWGIEEKVYVFDDSDLPEESLDLVENSLGLMYQVKEVYPGRGRSVSYRFLHLTLQEYLAAYHCSLDPTNRLEKVAGSLDRFLSNYHSTRAGICDHLAVWIFTAGLTKLSWIHQPLLLEIPQLLSSIAVTPMLHLLYEAQSPSLVLENLSFYTFSSDGSIEFKFFDMIEKSPLDWFVAGYCIPYSSRLWHLKTDSSCTDKHFDFLSKGLNVSSCQGCSGRIETLEVHASKIAMLHLLHPHTKALGELTIYAGYVDGTEKYAEQVVYNQFPSWYPLLKVLNIVNVSSLVLPLFEFLPKMCSGSLERLQLDFSPLLTRRQRPGNSSASKEDKDTIFKQLKECPVKQLKIKAQSRGHYPPLTISCKVESLQLTELTLTSALAECVGIEHNALHTLVLHSCKIPDDAGTALANSLQSPHCVLETIELDHKHDSSKIPDSVVEAIASCRTLKMCSMINCEDSILEHFVAGLKKNKSRVLEELTMCVNSFSSPGNVSELICVANEWSSITKMRLSSFLNNFVHQLDINFREDLVINYILV